MRLQFGSIPNEKMRIALYCPFRRMTSTIQDAGNKTAGTCRTGRFYSCKADATI
jgi:hypothetical protein